MLTGNQGYGQQQVNNNRNIMSQNGQNATMLINNDQSLMGRQPDQNKDDVKNFQQIVNDL